MKEHAYWLCKDEQGQAIAEYALVIAVVAIGLMAVFGLAAESIRGVFDRDVAAMNAAMQP